MQKWRSWVILLVFLLGALIMNAFILSTMPKEDIRGQGKKGSQSSQSTTSIQPFFPQAEINESSNKNLRPEPFKTKIYPDGGKDIILLQ